MGVGGGECGISVVGGKDVQPKQGCKLSIEDHTAGAKRGVARNNEAMQTIQSMSSRVLCGADKRKRSGNIPPTAQACSPPFPTPLHPLLPHPLTHPLRHPLHQHSPPQPTLPAHLRRPWQLAAARHRGTRQRQRRQTHPAATGREMRCAGGKFRQGVYTSSMEASCAGGMLRRSSGNSTSALGCPGLFPNRYATPGFDQHPVRKLYTLRTLYAFSSGRCCFTSIPPPLPLASAAVSWLRFFPRNCYTPPHLVQGQHQDQPLQHLTPSAPPPPRVFHTQPSRLPQALAPSLPRPPPHLAQGQQQVQPVQPPYLHTAPLSNSRCSHSRCQLTIDPFKNVPPAAVRAPPAHLVQGHQQVQPVKVAQHEQPHAPPPADVGRRVLAAQHLTRRGPAVHCSLGLRMGGRGGEGGRKGRDGKG